MCVCVCVPYDSIVEDVFIVIDLLCFVTKYYIICHIFRFSNFKLPYLEPHFLYFSHILVQIDFLDNLLSTHVANFESFSASCTCTMTA